MVTRTNRRAGWSDRETNLLWETADEAQQQGLPLKAVFEQIAEKTGRRPNSIRNFYYAQVQKREGAQPPNARFVPFTEAEVEQLISQVLRDRATGMSVRACLSKIAEGDHSLMLRYQNKYRAVIKNRPEYVREMVEKLNREGVPCTTPEVNHRTRQSADAACRQMTESAYRSGDADIVRACETLTQLIDTARKERRFMAPTLTAAAQSLIAPIKEYIALSPETRQSEAETFCRTMAIQVGTLEGLILADNDVPQQA